MKKITFFLTFILLLFSIRGNGTRLSKDYSAKASPSLFKKNIDTASPVIQHPNAFYKTDEQTKKLIAQIRKLEYAEAMIAQLYVDTVNVNQLTEAAIRAMVKKLDPHCNYTTPEETKRMNEPLKGDFNGIGIQFTLLDDTVIAVQVVPHGPSQKAGILPGDRLLSANGKKLSGVKVTNEFILNTLRGPKGSHVHIMVKRPDVKDLLSFDLVRDKIPLNTLDAAYIIKPGIGYIHLSRFGLSSGKEVETAIKKLKKAGMKSLIFDLTDNGGGYLSAAQDVANQFLNKGDLIVYTKGRAALLDKLFAKGNGVFRKGKLVILTNELTASAAEIVSGAIQDHDRGIIVGRRTFGKGLVQRPLSLPDGSMLALTIAHYYTPSGRCIQKPYKLGDLKDYQKDLDNRYKHGELFSKDSIHLDSAKVYYTLQNHCKVYGGGGIMPDVFVPLDTTRVTTLFMNMRIHNLLRELPMKYFDQHRAELTAKYAHYQEFDKSYEVPVSLIDEMLEQAKKKKLIPKSEKERLQTIQELKNYIKGSFIFNLFSMNDYYEYINKDNDMVNRALELLSKK